MVTGLKKATGTLGVMEFRRINQLPPYAFATIDARKMAARLQAATSSDRPILMRLETKAGHGAGKPRSKILDELADGWSFIFHQLGMTARRSE